MTHKYMLVENVREFSVDFIKSKTISLLNADTGRCLYNLMRSLFTLYPIKRTHHAHAHTHTQSGKQASNKMIKHTPIDMHEYKEKQREWMNTKRISFHKVANQNEIK